MVSTRLTDVPASQPAVILVVEDEAIIAEDIRQTLQHLGYCVPETVSSGPRALDAVGRLRPNLVLMDIKLAGAMDGIETAGRLRAKHDIPVVYLTSFSDEATLARAKETKPFGYLIKPFNDRELRSAIEVALHKHAMESALVESERWFSTTLRSIADAVIATDLEQRITFMNAAAETLTTWSTEEALGRPLAEVFRLVDRDGHPIASPVERGLLGGFAVALPPEAALLTRDGRKVNVDDSSSPIVDERGGVVGGVVVFRDISARRRLEARLSAAERLAAIGSMAAGMAHEINNPLTYVALNANVAEDLAGRIESRLREGGADPELVADAKELNAALHDVNSGAQRVLQLAREIRRLARAGASESVDVRVLDLPDVLQTALHLTQHTRSPQIRVVRAEGTTPYVEGSEAQLTQVFVNLLSNAADALRSAPQNLQSISLTTYTDEGGRAVVEVRDTGCGISRAHRARLFEPFFTTKTVGEGTGLGLAICHATIAAMGGTIEIESEASRGALFRIALPPAPSRPAQTLSGAPPASRVRPAKRGRVLVVDDEPALADAIARLLGAEHAITKVADGPAALHEVASAKEPFDVILCDLRMPHLSGLDVHSALAATNPEAAGRVVFMSAAAPSELERRRAADLPNPFLSKPFTAAAVRSVVADFLNAPREPAK